MSGTWNAFTGDVSTLYNRAIAPAAQDVGNFLSNSTNDLELGGGLLGAFLLPELLPGLASLFSGAGAAAIPDALGAAGSTGASALGFAGDVGGDVAQATLPIFNIIGTAPTVGAPLDLLAGGAAEGTALGAPLDLLGAGAGAAAGAGGATGIGAAAGAA